MVLFTSSSTPQANIEMTRLMITFGLLLGGVVSLADETNWSALRAEGIS